MLLTVAIVGTGNGISTMANSVKRKNAGKMITSAMNVAGIVMGTSSGGIIASALEYVDSWFGYKRNNKYIFN